MAMTALEYVLRLDTNSPEFKMHSLIENALYYKKQLELDYEMYRLRKDAKWLKWADKDSERYIDALRKIQEKEMK